MIRPKVFRDPIHVNIELDGSDAAGSLVLELLATPEIQRLRGVRQLALANLVYHGAEHSRFIHSLGVTCIAQQMLTAAARDADGQIDEQSRTVVLASALLHDVGHPPFSHAVEQQLGVNHEDLSIAVVTGDTAVGQILRSRGGDELARRIADHIGGTSDEPTTQFISSQLDADRSDYILRDGYYAGVPNARFDLHRIVQLLHVDKDGLLFDVRAQTAIEGYFIARYHLYLQLYYHKTVRSAEAMLRSLLRRARELGEGGHDLGGIADPVKRFFSGGASNEALNLTDHDLWGAFHVWARWGKDTVLRELCRRLRERDLFKAVEVPVDESVELTTKHLPKIHELARSKGFDPEYFVLLDTAKDTPYKIADISASQASHRSVRLLLPNGHVRSLEVNSGLIRQLQDEAYKKIRLCFPREIREEVLTILPTNMRV